MTEKSWNFHTVQRLWKYVLFMNCFLYIAGCQDRKRQWVHHVIWYRIFRLQLLRWRLWRLESSLSPPPWYAYHAPNWVPHSPRDWKPNSSDPHFDCDFGKCYETFFTRWKGLLFRGWDITQIFTQRPWVSIWNEQLLVWECFWKYSTSLQMFPR